MSDFRTRYPAIAAIPCVDELLTEHRDLRVQLDQARVDLDAACAMFSQAQSQAADNYREWGLCQAGLARADAENKRLAEKAALFEHTLRAIGNPRINIMRVGLLSVCENMRLAALATLEGCPPERNDP